MPCCWKVLKQQPHPILLESCPRRPQGSDIVKMAKWEFSTAFPPQRATMLTILHEQRALVEVQESLKRFQPATRANIKSKRGRTEEGQRHSVTSPASPLLQGGTAQSPSHIKTFNTTQHTGRGEYSEYSNTVTWWCVNHLTPV